MPHLFNRRRLLLAGAGALALPARAAPPVPLADLHSHYGLLSRTPASAKLGEHLREHRVALMCWKLVADRRWIGTAAGGIRQLRTPEPGDLRRYFDTKLDTLREAIATHGLRPVLSAADVDACTAGDNGVVLASEGADFLEGRIDGLAAAHAKGLRHLQLVHYILNPVGDFQTREPRLGGLSPFGRELVQACNERRILVDLAHCTGAGVEQALAVAKAPLVWSHGWVADTEGGWQDEAGLMARRLSLAHARKIADGGGVVGLCGLGLNRPDPATMLGLGGWTVRSGDRRAYARELASLVDRLGADHVAIGSDVEGVGPTWSVDNYGHVREVVDALADLKLAPETIEKLAWRNVARVLKAVLPA